MSKEVKGIEEALQVLAAMHICWATVNKIQNSLFEHGIAFFARDAHRVAYFDEEGSTLIIYN